MEVEHLLKLWPSKWIETPDVGAIGFQPAYRRLMSHSIKSTPHWKHAELYQFKNVCGYLDHHLEHFAVVDFDNLLIKIYVLHSMCRPEHFMCICIWTQSRDTSDSNFQQPFWLSSWILCICWYWFLHYEIYVSQFILLDTSFNCLRI